MINLIPKEEKKKMIRSFRYKLVVLLLVMVDVCFLIAFIAILPSYLLSSAKYNIVSEKLLKQKSEPVSLPDQQTLAIIKDANNKISLIENAEKNKFIVSQKVISAVLLRKMPEIRITDISYKNDPLVGRKVSIQGIAPSREILLAFRLALEGDASFKQVDLPISNFVKGSNIQFYLSLIPS